jgi:hypothetical protein
MARGMTQVEEHLPSKCKALNSNPSTAEKREREIPAKTKTSKLKLILIV